MDAVKLEAKWPPDRRSAIEASEFGIYKEPDDGKRWPRGTDRATGCLLVVSLLAAAAVVVYFAFSDYTIPTTQAAASAGPVVSYAKYVKSKQSAAAAAAAAATAPAATAAAGHAEDRSTAADAVVPQQDATPGNAENCTSTEHDDGGGGGGVRHTRMYLPQAPRRRPAAYATLGPGHGGHRRPVATTARAAARLEYADDGVYGAFGRRSDFPQLAAYRAPFPPKSVADVMTFVTGRPERGPHAPRSPHASLGSHGSSHRPLGPWPSWDHVAAAQETAAPRYVPIIRPAEEVNRYLPDAAPPAKGGSKRFRNKFGPPVYLTPPRIALPDDFMRPPDREAGYTAGFPAAADAAAALQDASASDSVRSHTDVVFRAPSGAGYAVPDSPEKTRKKKPPSRKRPISVMLDIYPMPGSHDDVRGPEDEEEEQNEEDDMSTEIQTSLKSNLQQSEVDDLLYRLNLISKLNEGSRRLTKNLNQNEQNVQSPIINLTTGRPLKDEEERDSSETYRWPEFDYGHESRIITNIPKNVKIHNFLPSALQASPRVTV